MMTDDLPEDPVRVDLPPPPQQDLVPPPLGHGIGSALSALLQSPVRVVHAMHADRPGVLILSLTVIALLCFAGFGLLVGNFSRGVQLWAAPLKITLGSLLAMLICFPSFYVFSCLAGAGERLRLGGLLGLLVGMLALEGLLLVSFAPVAWVFSESTESVAFIGMLYLLLWGVAVFFGLRFLRVGAAYLGTRDRSYLAVWGIIFILVNLQMMTALRPLVGTSPDLLPREKKFFFTHWRDSVRSEVNARVGRPETPY